ncbi:MAG TPA: M23 family metallopeptidase [Candidatus Dormibacteraeota bacterium]|nr:M23 family metallopeptidase [Candidatus Dormibacteraeota bacterium]
MSAVIQSVATVGSIFDDETSPIIQRFGDAAPFYLRLGMLGCDGVDWQLDTGVACRAAVAGQVVRAGWGGNGLGTAYGNVVEVWDFTQRCLLGWCHLSKVVVGVGQRVSADTVIGYTGVSGAAETPRLHFTFAKTDAVGNRLNVVNGFGGNLDCLDPMLVTWPPRPTPPPAPTPVLISVVVSDARGAALRSGPSAALLQVGHAKHGEPVVVNGWTTHANGSGSAAAADTWLRTVDGAWLESAAVGAHPADLPHIEWLPPPTLDPASAAPARDARLLLAGTGVWEQQDAYDYSLLAGAGVSWVAIRATNGAGSGHAAEFERSFVERAGDARAAGLSVLAWTKWYGPNQGVSGDVAEYLHECADYTAQRGFDAAGWVVQADDRHLEGLGAALRALCEQTGRPVYLAMPGDPHTRRLSWHWDSTLAPVEAVMPQVYTSPRAWNGSPDPAGSTLARDGFRDSLRELTAVASLKPILPISDEIDGARAAQWSGAARAAGVTAVSVWGWTGDNLAVLQPYMSAFAPSPKVTVPPASSPATAPGIPPAQIGGTTMGGGTVTVPVPPPTPAPQPAGWFGQLTTTGSDGIEQGVFTSEFLITQVGAVLATALGLAATFGWIQVTADERRQIVQLTVGVIALLEAVYTASRGLRKGLARP